MATPTSSLAAQAAKISEPSQKETLLLEERIRQLAHEIWLENGSPTGSELVDWLEAEKQILGEQR
jgi:DUF2934 family protein